jgi:hypothetical protein
VSGTTCLVLNKQYPATPWQDAKFTGKALGWSQFEDFAADLGREFRGITPGSFQRLLTGPKLIESQIWLAPF